MTDDVHQTLTRSTLFRGVSSSLVASVAARCEAIVLASQKKLLTAGTANDRLYLILSGSVSVRPAGAAEASFIRFGAGECVGATSLLSGEPVTDDVVADGSSVLIWFDIEQLWALIDASPDVARNFLKIVAGRARPDHTPADVTPMLRDPEQSAMIDPTTGLRNRRWLEDAFVRTIDRATRTAQPTSILIIEVDSFDEFRAQRGDVAADALLFRVGEVMVATLRPRDLLARYANQQFAVLLLGPDAAAAMTVAERLRRAMEATVTDSAGAPIAPITVSIGRTARRAFESLPDLLKRAEGAVARARETGHNRTSE